MKLLDIPGHKDLKRHPVTGKIYVRIYRQSKGKELCKSTKTDNLRQAREIADLYVQDYLGLKPKNKTIDLIGELWPQWINTKSEKSKNTQDSIKYSWQRLESYWKDLLPSEINSITWEGYIGEVRKANPDTKLFNDRKWFRSFILWLHENGFISNCPRLRNPDKLRANAGRYITKEEFKKLMAEANPELQLQMLMAYTMGMRISEIFCLTWGGDKQNTSYVDLEKKIIHLLEKDTKIRRSRSFGIHEGVYPELVLRHRNSSSEFIWPSLKDLSTHMDRDGNKTAWLNARKRSGVKCRFHDLRHTFLTNAFKAGEGKIDSMLICEYAGLSIEQAQKTYLHFDFEDTRAVSALITL